MSQELEQRPPKAFREYSELLAHLAERGMVIPDEPRALRKLESIGYYRLSGYWYPARIIREKSSNPGLSVRSNDFLPGTVFDDVVDLYVFDKKLRLLISDAIERIEVYIRSILAHEMGRVDATSYKVSKQYLQAFAFQSRVGKPRAIKWKEKHQRYLDDSKDDCILWHRQQQRTLPFWVCVEVWDFGLLSHFYTMLKPKYQMLVCERLAIDNTRTLDQWLRALNVLRNKCAHHARVWNAPLAHDLHDVKNSPYFESLQLDSMGYKTRNRVYGALVVLWYLMQQFCPHSTWPRRVEELLTEKPARPWCPDTAMGLPEDGFPLQLFQ